MYIVLVSNVLIEAFECKKGKKLKAIFVIPVCRILQVDG